MEKLVCDRCGFMIEEREDVALALDGTEAWEMACRTRGEEVRGLFPCKYYFQCKGQMVLVTGKEKRKKGEPARGK
jgi:hypothetical protein